MTILYQAEDGTIFLDENACHAYEAGHRFPELFTIDFYDAKNRKLFLDKFDIFNDKIYNECEKINIHDQSELVALHWLAYDTGWCEWEDIESPGEWVRKDDLYGGFWIKKEKEEND